MEGMTISYRRNWRPLFLELGGSLGRELQGVYSISGLWSTKKAASVLEVIFLRSKAKKLSPILLTFKMRTWFH